MTGDAGNMTADQFLDFNDRLFDLVGNRRLDDENLFLMAEQMVEGRLDTFVESVSIQLEHGTELSEALKAFESDLPDSYTALLRAGETIGSLDEVLDHILAERRRNIRERGAIVLRVIAPPLFLLLALAVMGVVVIKFVPEVVAVYAQLGAELPLYTRVIINTVYAIRDHFVLILAAGMVPVAAIVILMTGRFAAASQDSPILNLPIVGRSLLNGIMIAFSHSLAVLLDRAVAPADALALTHLAMRNEVGRQLVSGLRARVLDGESLDEIMKGHPYFLPALEEMPLSPDDENDVARTLAAVTDVFEGKQRRIRRIAGRIATVVFVLMLIATGVVIVLLFLPLLNIPNVIM